MASSFPEILEDLEKQLSSFTIAGGPDVAVEGSFDKGFAVNIRKPIEEVVAPTGACCIGGNCSVTTQVFCELSGGTYQGDNTTCSPNPCPPAGACCVDGDCTIETEEDCSGMGGEYQGDSTSCDPNPCITTGACCVDSDCTIETEEDCIGMGGLYQGDDTDCDPNPCVEPECECGGFTGFMSINQYFTRTTHYVYTDSKSSPFPACNSSFDHITIEQYDPDTCEIKPVACSGGGSYHNEETGDDFTWTYEFNPDLRICLCVASDPEFTCTPCGFGDCNACGLPTPISDTLATYHCDDSSIGFTATLDCTVTLSNPCIPA